MIKPGIPRIDVSALLNADSSPQHYTKAMSELYLALSDIGFAIIVGNGLKESTLGDMRQAVKQLFDLPRDRLKMSAIEADNYRGYVPLGCFTPNSGKGEADHYEAWKLHNETDPPDAITKESRLYRPNRWPEELPELKPEEGQDLGDYLAL